MFFDLISSAGTWIELPQNLWITQLPPLFALPAGISWVYLTPLNPAPEPLQEGLAEVSLQLQTCEGGGHLPEPAVGKSVPIYWFDLMCAWPFSRELLFSKLRNAKNIRKKHEKSHPKRVDWPNISVASCLPFFFFEKLFVFSQVRAWYGRHPRRWASLGTDPSGCWRFPHRSRFGRSAAGGVGCSWFGADALSFFNSGFSLRMVGLARGFSLPCGDVWWFLVGLVLGGLDILDPSSYLT